MKTGIIGIIGWIREIPNRVQEFDNRPWPSMRDEQRSRVGSRAFHVHEVNVEIVDGCQIVGMAVKFLFRFTPVVVVSPVLTHFLNVGQRYALSPVCDQFLFGPARQVKTSVEVVDRGLRYIDRELSD